ncbi:hypothetical protein TNCV_306931 [Trichonephila clavipes]|nr:hypothetical protein TNCV_306931 [Trichonephila clavipes]
MSSFLVLSERDTRNRWRDGQVCPDVGQGTMAPWARRPGRKRRKKEGEERRREKTGEREKRKKERREREDGKGERGARLAWRKGLSPEIGVERR